ncbi:MAG: sulfide/dihydroorotate dehydrogenase-like FAD/NAD-binding protein [Kineosporiaceae bacterium]|nr:sulfide/dihydroorotate dehydrogenase-like FAD/NAD-binding protein [Kineosporiaceae bacterium]MBK7621614.1 sulfide/dihydroorotate dehydrogenase-like FAD/NAD-binding protein [Kineosporiaceae bacterium]MBK8077219.1 sulfide/dihydroorotate dehydrogenase-like FAD/NAD-binding protein [Kineosporiaceae bacterium]
MQRASRRRPGGSRARGVPASSFEIVARQDFSDVSYLLEVHHPLMARAALPGQFVIVMSHPEGERIPLTLADFDREAGTITLVVQAVGKSTLELQRDAQVGTTLYGIAGPLGMPSPIHRLRTVICVGGGLGVAPTFPQARAFHENGTRVVGVLGFRSAGLVFWEDKFREVCDDLILCTDDGSAGIQGRVTDGLTLALDSYDDVDEVVAIGPPVMMAACAEVTRPRGVRTSVSLNPIMVDGTGMCGGCRVRLKDGVKFACVDGPDFDAHQVDFAELINRLGSFRPTESQAVDAWEHSCQRAEQASAETLVSGLPTDGKA